MALPTVPMLPDRRRLLVTAAPGFGKSWLVRAWLADQRATWADSDVDPAAVEDWLVIDDLPMLDTAAAQALVARLDRLPATTRVVLISRTPWPGRLPADCAALDAHDLALPEHAVARVLAEEYGLGSADLAAAVHELTAGWPSLVHRAGRHLQGGTVATLCAGGAELDAYVADHVLGHLSAAERRLLGRLGELGTVCEDLVGPRDRRTLRLLTRTGLVLPAGAPPGTYGLAPMPHWLRPVPALAAVAAQREPLPAPARRRLHTEAGAWHADRSIWTQAAHARLRAGDRAGVAALLREHGSAIVAAGGAGVVIDAATADADDGLRLLHGEALAVTGRLDEALACLTPLLADRASIEPGLAWRLGLAYYARAEHRAAFDVLGRGRLDRADTVDEALLLSWTATVHWSVGDRDACRDHAERARHAAAATGDDRALAAAHVALALHAVLTGDRASNIEQYAIALAHAEAARDAVQAARIRSNRLSQLLEEARYPQALTESAEAVAAAEASGNATALTVALVNRSEALARLGRLDEAERCGERALAISQRAGSGKTAYALTILGDVRARRGQRSLARAAYEEAVRAADTDGMQQCFVPALAGLACLVAYDDPATARRHAETAASRANGPLATRALLAVGWAAIAAGDGLAAAAAADRAEDSARLHRDRAGLAEALELRADTSDRPSARRTALTEAARTWRATGARLDADRVACRLGQLPGASDEEQLASRVARASLEAAGVLPAAAGDPSAARAPHVAVRVLGRFEVLIDEAPGPAWRSRKAQDLLRILVARRGRRVAREELAGLLWPDDDDHQAVAHRLSVALSTLRSVLDPDRRLPSDHYVFATSTALAADPAHLDIDLDTFLGEAEIGRRLHEQRRFAEAREVLAAAERRYVGDVFEDEPYDDWAVPAREEARATYLRITRLLAALAADRGATDEALGYLLRILARDPYDEPCHREVVKLLDLAGRHGEAKRARLRYADAMREIGRGAEARV
ncbi:BTAD domain-containing putative transcriptional regulator [Catellatospora vulcania]|uniref:BTAD domain-containing putative transcriptional regulator n=1 Tax=Catellatospora vulcania TaxID=1460450 RepID=UPI0012D43496|nr:BTAD domain-containing putative transcriptional regulator [Catellatospora vulcania]